MESSFYNFSSVAITSSLFLIIIMFNEVGYHLGRFVQTQTDEEIKYLTGAIQASILGLLALLLGFTFSMSMQRYDNRSQALLSEVNSIGTVILRTQLLPARYQDEATRLMQKYVDLRIAIGKIDLTEREDRKKYHKEISGIQGALWALAIDATLADPRPVTTGAFVNALNDMIDDEGKRSALLQMHVPEIVLFLLFLVFISSGGILGYSSGLSGRRVVAPTIMVSFLIALIVFIILDLDRPRRGFIQVNQAPMIMLKESFE